MILRALRGCIAGLGAPRPLAAVERAFLVQEFGSSLPVARLRIAGGGQPTGRAAWQPWGGLIQLDDRYFEQADPSAPLAIDAYPSFAHEALHVWQRVHRHCVINVSIDGLWLGAFQGRRAYRYDRTLVEPAAVLATFRAGNIEQQGQMFEDYVRSNICEPQARDPRFALVARYVRSGGRDR